MQTHDRLSSGVPGLDEILCGGFLVERPYLVLGGPGTGKTTVGMHFLEAGARRGEPVLCLNHGEPTDHVQRDAKAMGIDVSGVEFLDLSPDPESFAADRSYDVFAPGEVESKSFSEEVVQRVRDLRPTRVYVDAMGHVRALSTNMVDFRRRAHAMVRFLSEQGSTALFGLDSSTFGAEEDLQSMVSGVLRLRSEQTTGRALSVTKLRGSDYRTGWHRARISDRGFSVAPEIVQGKVGRPVHGEQLSSDNQAFDALLHGGIERGTVTLMTGPNGVGKTTLGLHFVREAARRDERAVVYAFEETATALQFRAERLGSPLGDFQEQGTLSIVAVRPLYYGASEFASLVRTEVEERNARVVMLDSMAGYQLSVYGEDVIRNLFALCRYLTNLGVTVILIDGAEDLIGPLKLSGDGMGCLADNVVYLRYLEEGGELCRCVGVLKKRLSDFDKAIHEFEITASGLRIGPPLPRMREILSGAPPTGANAPAKRVGVASG